MGDLVLGAQQEGLFAIAFFQPIEGFVGDDFGGVPSYLGFSLRGQKRGVEVGTLSAFAGKNFPSLKFVRWVAFEVPLADQPSLVAGFSEFPGVYPLATVPLRGVSDYTICETVLSGEDGGPTGTAD